MEWTTALSLAARLGKQGYDHRYSIQKYWTHLKAYLDLGATQVVITGHAGAGKTLLASQMHGRARDLSFELPPESRTVDVLAINAGAWARLVRVLPGQDGFRTKGAVEAFQGNKALEGVIHVVDFGYVAPRDPVDAASLLTVDHLDTIQKLRDRNLRLELEDLRVVLTDVRRLHATERKPKWILIAVNKVDLFPSQRHLALQHYHPSGLSDFSRMLRDFQLDIGANNVGVYVAQTCAYEQDFEWNGQTAASSLHRQEQDEILRNFTKTMAAISEAHA